MNGRELLLNALSGLPTPRVPVAPFFFQNVVNEYYSGQPGDQIAAGIELYKRFGFDILLRNYIIGDFLDESLLSCENWTVEKQVINKKADSNDEKTTITTPERVLTQVKGFCRVSTYETVEAVTEYYIKSKEDFEQFKKYQPKPIEHDCRIVTHARELVGDDGLTGTWIGGAFNAAGTYRELSQLLMDPYLDEDFYLELMEYFYARTAEYMRQAISAGADFISISGNMANGSMAGPRFFKEHVMPFEKRIIDYVHSLGCKVIYHNCGDASSLFSLYSQMGIDMYESLTSAPYGDTDLQEALSSIALPTALSGGVDQIEFLKSATPSQVRERVKHVLELAKKRGGFILAASDYFSEGTPEENIMALAEAGFEFGKY